MRKLGLGKRLLTTVLALAMLISIVPAEVFSDAGDFSNTGSTGLVGDIVAGDTINWPIKIYDYLNDGMLFEYSSALHTSASPAEGAAYGGGQLMPTTEIIGNDYTFYYSGDNDLGDSVTGSYIDPYQEYAYTNWLDYTDFYNDSSSKGGYSTTKALKYLHLALKAADTDNNTIPFVISDFYSDNTTAGYSPERVQYAVVVYRTNISHANGARINMGWATNIEGGNKYSTGGTYRVPRNWPYEYMEYVYRGAVTLTADEQWHSVVIPMNAGTVGSNWDKINKVYTVLMDVAGMDATTEYLDVSHVAYFSTEAEASNYGDDAVAFVRDPGEYLLDQTYTTGTTVSITKPAGSALVINYPDNAKHFTDSPYTLWGTSASKVENGDKDYAKLTLGSGSAYVGTGLGGIARTDARYITIVYRTHDMPSSPQIGFWLEGSGEYNSTGNYYVTTVGMGGSGYSKLITLPQSTGDEWISLTYDLSWLYLSDTDYSLLNTINSIGAYLPTSGSIDIAYIDYDATLEEAHTFAEDAVNYMNNNTTKVGKPTNGSSLMVDLTTSGNSKTNFTSIFKDTWSSTIYYADALTVKDISTTNKGYLNISTDASIYKNSDSDYERTYLMVHDGGASKTDNDFVTIVYRTHNMTSSDKIGFWVEFATGAGYGAGMGDRGNQYTTLTTLPKSETKWVSATFDLSALITDGDYDKTTYPTIYRIGVFLPGFTNDTQSMDIAYIDYHSTKALGEAFGADAAAYMNSGSTSSSSGGTYTKHWNMGGNSAFTMLLPSGGGGWSDDNIRGGENDWGNGYFTYSIGITDVEVYDSAGMEIYNRYWDFDDDRDTAATMGYVVSDDIFTLQPATSISTKDLDLGYHLYNTAINGPYTIGLLGSSLATVTKGDHSYKVIQYKDDTIDYIAQLLEASLKIPQTDQYGNYNYTFVQGSKSDQFAYTWDGTAAVAGVDGKTEVDLATALRKRLGISFESTAYDGGKVLSDATTPLSRGKASDLDDAKRLALIGSFQECVGQIDSFAAAAYYLLHNLFVDNAYSQVQNDFNYLQLSKATIADSDTDASNNKSAYVFDAGFTTGPSGLTYDATTGQFTNAAGTVVYSSVAEYYAASQSGVDYSPLVKADGTAGTGIISLVGATTKDEIYYSGSSDTTRFPFLPVVDATDEYAGKTPTYFAEDQAESVLPEGAGYADRNYNYVMQANGEFIYHYEDSLFFEFSGDDDVYLFINDELVLDIGAAHSITNVAFDMNDYVLGAQTILGNINGYSASMSDEAFSKLLTDNGITSLTIDSGDYAGTYDTSELKRWHKLNLVDGESYAIDFYYMERHGWGANMRIVTNIVMTDPALGCEKTAYQNGTEIPYGGIVEKTNAIEYSFALTNNGNSKLYNLTFDDHDIGVRLDPQNGLTVSGSRVSDASGTFGTLEASDLVAYVDGYYEDGTPYETIKVTFADNDALKKFLTDLTGEGLQSGESTGSSQSGGGLWKGSSVTFRGIYYTMSTEQQAANQFDNTVYVTGDTALENGSTINSEAEHRVRSVANAIHFYQWAGNPIGIHRDYVYSQLTDAVKAKFGNNSGRFVMYTCQSDGTDYNWANVTSSGGTLLNASYTTPGRHLIYIKLYVDMYTGTGTTVASNQKPDVLEDDNTGNNNSYELIPVIFYVTDVEDSTLVLDYGLKADLTGEGGIYANDVVQPHSNAKHKIMGITSTVPSYMEYTWNNSASTPGTFQLGNDNRIDFTPASGNVIDSVTATVDGEEVTTAFDGEYCVEDGKLYFTPNAFMDDTYSIYAAVSVYDADLTGIPHAVGPANTSTTNKTYDLDISKEVQMYQKVTVLPANVVYYEDDFAGVTYSGSGTFTPHGTGSGSLLQGVDQNIPYGQDAAYQDTYEMSGNSLKEYSIPTTSEVFTSFTFTGTGFEILSRTDALKCGTMTVEVFETDADGKKVSKDYNGDEKIDASDHFRLLPVITEFDNVSTGSGGSEIIYQVPVIRVDGLDKATYIVEISGSPEFDADAPKANWVCSRGITQQQLDDLLDNDNDKYDGFVVGSTLRKEWVEDDAIPFSESDFNKVCYRDGGTTAEYAYTIEERTQNLLDLLGEFLPSLSLNQNTLYIDGIRIFQPLGADPKNSSGASYYNTSEAGASFSEVRQLLMNSQASIANWDSGFKLCTGNIIWSENRNGVTLGDGSTYTSTFVDSIEDYVVSGPNNELYFRRTAATTGTTNSEGDEIKNFQMLMFYVQDKTSTSGTLQIATRGIDRNLFEGKTGNSVDMDLRYLKQTDTGIVEQPLTVVAGSTEQYYTIDYTSCPTTTDKVTGKTVYQVMLLARTTNSSTGMLSFTSLKHNGLDILPVFNVDTGLEDAQLMSGSEWSYDSSGRLVGPDGTPLASAHFDLREISQTMQDVETARQLAAQTPGPDVNTVTPAPVSEGMNKTLQLCILVIASAAALAGAWFLTKKFLHLL